MDKNGYPTTPEFNVATAGVVMFITLAGCLLLRRWLERSEAGRYSHQYLHESMERPGCAVGLIGLMLWAGMCVGKNEVGLGIAAGLMLYGMARQK